MTALNFWLLPDQVYVCCDSLAVLPESKEPHIFCSKLFLLPHARSVVCGTGSFQLVQDWFAFANSRILASDVDALSANSEAGLQDVASAHPEDQSSTIYQFGWSLERAAFRGFVYRSTTYFSQEEFPMNAFGLKPQTQFDWGAPTTLPSIIEKFRDLVIQQRREDLALPQSDRVGIGGQVYLAYMIPEITQLVCIHQFEDYDTLGRSMEARLLKQTNSEWEPT